MERVRTGGAPMRRLKFAWIDDKTQKVEAYRSSIENRPKDAKLAASVEVLQVKQDLLQQLELWASSWQVSPPDLIIIDHILTWFPPWALRAHRLRICFAGGFPLFQWCV